MRINKKKIFRVLKVLLLVYALLGIVLYYVQESILFHSVPIEATEKFQFNVPHNELNIPYDDNTNINLVEFLPADSTSIKGIVIYFHGNKTNINRYAKFATNFTKEGYVVLMPDYPGFGKSTGKISEELLYKIGLQVYQLAKSKFNTDSIIIYGKSLGTGIASYVASRKNCKQLILETPYYSMISLWNNYAFMYPLNKMLQYKLPSHEYVKKVIAPITIFQGTKDWVVPYSNAIKLKTELKPSDHFITILNAHHNNIPEFSIYQQELSKLLQ